MIGKKFKFSEWTGVYCVIALFMAAAFCCIYGVRILNPVYTEWLIRDGDTPIHYMGWKAYRVGDWMFPIGCTDVLSYPDKVSVIFTDSIPCFAVIFKLLSPILPKEFQYFGLWGIMCFVLQGILSARIIRYYVKNKLFVMFAGIIFGFVPVMIWRMYAHTALAGQWVILLALEPVFEYKSYTRNNKILKQCLIVGLLATSIHLYFVAMCGIALIGYCIADFIESKNIRRCICIVGLYLVTCTITIGVLGGFSSGVKPELAGLGIHSMNFNALFNPQSWSCIFQNMPLYGTGQYEGFAYLGAGCLFLSFFASMGFLCILNVKKTLSKYKYEILALCFIFILSFIIALSPIVTVGEQIFLEYKIPGPVYRFWSIFRASGRMIWVSVYIIMICSVIMTYKIAKSKRMSAVLLVICTMIQIYDIHDILLEKNNIFNCQKTYQTSLKDKEFWQQLGKDRQIEHIFFVQSGSLGNEIYDFAEWATNYKKTINRFYFARQLSDEVMEINLEKALSEADNSKVFIFLDNSKMRTLTYDLNYYLVDGYIIGYSGLLNYADASTISDLDLNYTWTFSQNCYLQNGRDNEGVRTVYPGGYSYGPYWDVPRGKYHILITGNHLDIAELAVYSEGGEKFHDFQIINKDVTSIAIDINFINAVNNLEVFIHNISDQNIELNNIRMQYIG